MKKTVALIGLVSLFAGTAVQAQDSTIDPRERFSIGAKVGANLANVWDARGEEFQADAKLGFAGGIFVGIPIGKFLGVQPELLISQKGFKASGRLLGENYGLTRTNTYLDIPLQVQVKPIEYFTLLAGPQFSYLLHQRDQYSFGQNSIAQETEFENDNIRKNILGFVVGFDVNIKFMVFSTRAGWDFQTNHGDGTSSTPRYKNRWLQFTLGVKI
jgi:hypothetical protein